MDARITAAREQERHLSELAAGSLPVEVEPRSLFGIDLDDEDAVAVEVRRLRALTAAEAGDGDAMADVLFRARLAVDRARLAVLDRPPAALRELLADHAARRAAADAEQPAAAAQREAQQKAQREAEQAAAERRRALEAMEAARTEALRLVAKERARLLGVREAQSTFEAIALEREEQLAARAEHVLALRRRVEELLERPDDPGRKAAASALYDELRTVLRRARGDLADALAEARRDATDVPVASPDELGDLVVDRSEIDRLQAELRERARELDAAERERRWARARALHETVIALNRARHGLYPSLPPPRREALTGYGPEGRDQARGEVDQLDVVIAYHAEAIGRWIGGASRDRIVRALVSTTGVQILGILVALAWWRRAATRWLEGWRGEATRPGRALDARLETVRQRLVAVALRIHRPLATLVALRVVGGVLDPALSATVEVRIAWIVVAWSLGGVVVVNAIDALLARRRWAGAPKTAAPVVRLRSLRLLGWVAVSSGLVLDVSATLVGRGTLHAWVVRATWLALMVVALVLLRWWRPIVLERIRPRAAKSRLAAWVCAQPGGPRGFLAGAVGAVYLVGVGVGRLARAQMGAFDATRRVLAFLFRREVSRAGKDRAAALAPLDAARHAALDPDAASDVEVAVEVADLARIDAAVEGGRGGLYAVIGERGSGKSTVVRRLAVGRSDVLVIEAQPGGLRALRPRLVAALGLDADVDDARIDEHLRSERGPRALVIDDAQRLVLPAVGGLDDLDELFALARASRARCAWIFCFGAVMWQFIEGARGVRPLFDEVVRTRPWTEEQIGELIRARSAAAGLTPSFRELQAHPPVDETEREELAQRTEASYYRLLWDASGGNPGVALHMWRQALRVAEDGAVVVSLYTGPDARELSALPLDIVLVLRSVLRLERVELDDVASSTQIPLRSVHDTVHFACSRGYVEEHEGRYRVTWTWLRSITVHLQRRRLMA